MASEEDDIKFVSKLNEESKKKAKRELNELNDTDRILAVQSLRQWILQQKWLKTPTDFEFLLRFLRARKFSQLEARKTLENYWTCKTKTPEWYRNVDPCEPILQEIIKTGFYIVPRQLDKYGRRVFIERYGKFNDLFIKVRQAYCYEVSDWLKKVQGKPLDSNGTSGRLNLNDVKKKWGVDNVYRAITLICDWAIRDEHVQVNGLAVLMDNTDVTMNHMMMMWHQDNGKRIMQFYQNSLPARIKGIHMYNEPTFFDAAFALFSHLMKQKTKDRLFLHGRNLTKVYEEIGMTVLPEEYLPDEYDGPSVGTREQIVDDMLADMMSDEFRAYIKDLSSDKYGVNFQKRKSDADTPVASFRKLNID